VVGTNFGYGFGKVEHGAFFSVGITISDGIESYDFESGVQKSVDDCPHCGGATSPPMLN
jgi:hypothetical protein